MLDVNVKVHVEVRVKTTGNAQAGFAYKAYGYGLLPYFAGPYATYKPSTFDMGFTVNGEINANIPTDLKPYANMNIVIQVYDKNSNPKFSQKITTDAEGKFYFKGEGYRNITPSDSVYIDIPRIKGMVQETYTIPAPPKEITYTAEVERDITPIIEVDNKKFRVVGKSSEIKPTVPFSQLDFNVDTFNDIITGWVSGNYTGTVIIKIGEIYKYPRAENRIFKISHPIDEHTGFVNAWIDFEGSRFPDGLSVSRMRNLDALTLVVFNEFKPAEATTETQEKQDSEISKWEDGRQQLKQPRQNS